MLKNSRRIKILDVPLDCVDMEKALDYVKSMLVGESAHSIIALNPEKVIRAKKDNLLFNTLKNSSLIIPDGIGVVVAAWILYGVHISRVPGSELMPEICKMATQLKKKVYLFGGTLKVNDNVVEVLTFKYPELQIVGHMQGFINESEMPVLVEDINKSGADILFVALGSPKQEQWIEKYLPQLKVKVCQGVGGTFDVLSGDVKRAPRLFRDLYLEWLYRLISQPKRLFRQTALPKFVWLVILQKIMKKIDSDF